ncbi:GTP-binding protein [Venturia nashicola]|nr:GTP-binding protein [Venturia nashicola]
MRILPNEMFVTIGRVSGRKGGEVQMPRMQATAKAAAEVAAHCGSLAIANLDSEPLTLCSSRCEGNIVRYMAASMTPMEPTNFFSLPRELRQLILVYSDNSSRIYTHPHRWWSALDNLVRVWEEKRIVDWANVLKKVDERMVEDVDYAAGRWTHGFEDWMGLIKSSK